MKKHILTLASLLALGTLSAQVRTVNSATNVSVTNSPAFIDASSNTTVNGSSNVGKGLIFPRVDLSAMTAFPGVTAGIANSFPTRFDGMIVYNTASSGTAGVGSTQGTLSPGYWYYENKSSSNTGGTWKPVSTATSAVANTASNGLTLAGNDVKLGGTLSQATDIATAGNNLTISGSGNLGIGNTAPTSKIDIMGNANIIPSGISNIPSIGLVRIGNTDYSSQTNQTLLSLAPGILSVDAPGVAGGRFIVDGSGNVGVGTNAPTAKLEINNGTTAGAIKITDGTQGAGKVLTSDANGVASWTNTVTTAFANAWSSYTGTLGNPFGGTTGGSGLATGISIIIPAKGWYFFRSGITISSLCNDYWFYINGIGEVWRTYCGGSSPSGETMVPRDQTRVLYFASPGTYTILAGKTNSNVPTFYNPGNPAFYLDFVKFQN